MADVSQKQTTPQTTDNAQLYLPSSTEKKRAVIMYLLIGIIGSVGSVAQQSEYERFHLKQAMGWRIVFLLILILSVILLFIPLIRFIPLLIILGMIIILAICIKQASDGKYNRSSKSSLSIFAGIGEWIM